MKFITIATAIFTILALTACGKGDGSNSTGTPAVIAASISGTYKNADGSSILNFSAGKVRITQKNGRSYEYQYASEGQSVKWIYEETGIPESCEIKSSATIYCSSATTIYTKID